MSNPSSLTYNPQSQNDPKQRYRLIDPPLPRYIIGLGRSLVGIEPLQIDWDWGKSWEENRLAGALPETDLLFVSRLAVTLLLPMSLVFLYLSGKELSGGVTGLIAMAFMGTNALTLLHGRRAMAEGVLILGITLFMWSLIKSDQYPWLTGLASAVALNAKQSSLALFPAGLIAVCWIQSEKNSNIKNLVLNIAKYVGAFVFITWVLNPVIWREPIDSLKIAMLERQDLLARQTADTRTLSPEKVLDSPIERGVSIIANIYIISPMFSEAGNYLSETEVSEEQYLSTAGQNLWRGYLGGGVLFTLTIFGITVGIFNIRNKNYDHKRYLTLLLIASIFQLVALIVAIPLPWQRYVIPLVPFTIIWIAHGIGNILSVKVVIK